MKSAFNLQNHQAIKFVLTLSQNSELVAFNVSTTIIAFVVVVL